MQLGFYVFMFFAKFLVNTAVLLFERNGWVLIEIGLEWSKIQANIMNFHLKPISESNLKQNLKKIEKWRHF